MLQFQGLGRACPETVSSLGNLRVFSDVCIKRDLCSSILGVSVQAVSIKQRIRSALFETSESFATNLNLVQTLLPWILFSEPKKEENLSLSLCIQWKQMLTVVLNHQCLP